MFPLNPPIVSKSDICRFASTCIGAAITAFTAESPLTKIIQVGRITAPDSYLFTFISHINLHSAVCSPPRPLITKCKLYNLPTLLFLNDIYIILKHAIAGHTMTNNIYCNQILITRSHKTIQTCYLTSCTGI